MLNDSDAGIYKQNTETRKQPTQDSIYKIGKTVFYTHCSSCHKDSAVGLAPGYTILTTMTPRSILAALNTGKMQPQARGLTSTEREAVARWITNSDIKTTTFPSTAYTSFTAPATASPYDHSGWGNNLAATGFRSAQQSGISKANIGSLKLKWAFAFPEATAMRTKPAILGDWLLVGGQFGEVLAIHRNTGKIGWQFLADAGVRGAITIVRTGPSAVAFFADYTTNVYALDVQTGKLIWKRRAGFDTQSSNTGSVAVHNGIVYIPISSVEVAMAFNGNYPCCTSSGGVVALDAKTGKPVWTYRVLPKASLIGKNKKGKPVYAPSGAPVWCSPTVDAKRGLLYIGTGENYTLPATTTSDAIQALDLKTGALKWTYQGTAKDAYNLACPVMNNCPDTLGPDLDFGMAPILVKRKDGKEILVAGQKSGVVHAVWPESGKLIWKTKIGKGGMLGGIHWGMATDGNYVYACNADNIYAVDKKDTVTKVSPGVYALNLFTGKMIWKTASPACTGRKGCLSANSAAPVVTPGIVWAGGLDGIIRAYDAATGKIIWEFDTVKDFETVNGIKGHGGAIDGPPPVISNGMLFVNSGYGLFSQLPGNVLLAFAIEK
jgi:polyvinyl alcohol dehydrogenase (cytochrome)